MVRVQQQLGVSKRRACPVLGQALVQRSAGVRRGAAAKIALRSQGSAEVQRPRLIDLKAGEVEEIVIWAPD